MTASTSAADPQTHRQRRLRAARCTQTDRIPTEQETLR